MSGSTIGGVVGGVVGFWVGGPQGAYYGWMIGSAVGGYVDPEVIEGPRLKDLRNTTSTVGGVIPRAWGTAPVPCNIIWQQPGVTEHESTDDGKGSGTEQVTFTYTRSYAVMFHLGEIAGVLQIKRNGKIVYDARDDATLEQEYTDFGMTLANALARISNQRAMNARFINQCTIYLGTQTQNPDPTIEAYLGVGNVPSYRGRAYMVVTDDDVTDLAGAIPQYEVIVASCGDVNLIPGGATWLLAFNDSAGAGTIKESPDGWDWSATATSAPLSGGGSFSPTGSGFLTHHDGTVLGTSSSSSGIGGSQRFGFRDADGDWHPVTLEVGSSSGMKPIWTGTHWMICQHTGGQIEVSSDGQAFAATGYEAQSIAKTGGQVLTVYATGASFDIVACRLLESDGTNAGSQPDLHTGYITRRSVIDSDGSTVGMAVEEEMGGDRRVHVFSTIDKADTWTEHTSPFPDFTGALSHRLLIHFAPLLGQWVVCARDRVAMGGSMSSLSLEATTFPGEIRGIDSDGQKIVICGEDGLLYAWTPDEGWQSLSGGEGRSIMDVVAFGVPEGAVPMPDAPGSYVGRDSSLYSPGEYTTLTPCGTTTIGEIVAELCEMSGLTADEYDVSQLTDVLTGYVVARETDAASVIESLRPIGMFDPAEWDGKVRFIKRGGTAVGSINGDDLVERDGDAFERELVQEAELLRRVTTGYLDPATSFAPNTQKYERRAGTVRALGEATFEVSAVMDADQAATVSKRKVLTAWGEPEKQKCSLPYRLAKYTPTDILNYTDADGEVDTIRLMQIEDDSGIRYTESALNCAEAYEATATGVAPKPPTITDADLIGPTNLVVMDLPLWRTTDPDELVLYAAASGHFNGWAGAQVSISTDGGTSYVESHDITKAAVIGYTTSGMKAWHSSEYPDEHDLTVYLPSAPSSVSYETLLHYANRSAVQLDSGSWEILQYQTVTALGDDLYTLSGLLRGRYNTTPGSAVAGRTFVLLNDAVQAFRAEHDTIGQTLTIRATSFGTSPDAAVPFDFDFADAASQTEWPVHMVEATRDGSDNVTVTAIIRDRLGTETSRYPSAHFIGLRFNYTDGSDTFSYDVSASSIGTASTGSHTYTDAMQTADFGSVPASLTVTVEPLNNITGAGPASAGVTV